VVIDSEQNLSSVRQQKVEAQIQRLVADYIQRELADPRASGLITVTRVEISPDLLYANVYVSIFGNRTPTPTVFAAMTSATRQIQQFVAKGLPIRTAPRLTIHLDEKLKKEADILKTIDKAMKDTPPVKSDD
jgi:ribosome-binding factor A